MADAPARRFSTPMEDSLRWRNIARRAGDIVISTPPKCGTTWTQGIVHSLLWPDGGAPGSRGELSPWVDARLEPIDALAKRLEAQPHRRFLKTHSPGDCTPFDSRCRYLVVYRDPRDALVSWGNHRATMRPEIVDAINQAAAGSGTTPLDRTFDGDYDDLYEEWQAYCSPVLHLRSWWQRRSLSNVRFVHYADLLTDIEGEMRRIAEFLEIEVPASSWPEVVERCSLESMRAAAEARGGMDRAFEGGAAAFFNKGVNGRWSSILSSEQIEAVLLHMTDALDEESAEWLTNGSIAQGWRPDELALIEQAPEHRRPNPLYGRIDRRSANSIHGIAERRVEEAREEGLFDNLALYGKPIPDLGQRRPTGWWANRFVAKERHKVKELQLEDDIRAAMPALWRLPDEAAVTAEVEALNIRIESYNRVTTLEARALLDNDETLATWRRLRSRD